MVRRVLLEAYQNPRLRKVVASLLTASDIPLKTILNRLGWKEPTSFISTYLHDGCRHKASYPIIAGLEIN